eukprot:scaffold26371_cov117-Cylindrotheca_fusiformis.AAC.2
MVLSPIGWANASNWNKRNSVSKNVLTLENGKQLDVEVRLISYSEHSAFPELIDFVQYLKPRKVIPTVFQDEADCRKIQDRFRHLIDSARAKQAFFRSMEKSGQKNSNRVQAKAKDIPSTKSAALCGPSSTQVKTMDSCKPGATACDSSEVEILKVKPNPKRNTEEAVRDQLNTEDITSLVGMGFDERRARKCLMKYHGNLHFTVEALLSGETDSPKLVSPSGLLSPKKKQRTSSQITSFFSKKTF